MLKNDGHDLSVSRIALGVRLRRGVTSGPRASRSDTFRTERKLDTLVSLQEIEGA